MGSTDFTKASEKWWVQAATPELRRKPKNKKLIEGLLNASDLMGEDTSLLVNYLKQLAPRKSKTDPLCISYYDNSYKYANDNLTKTSSGKFFRKVFPNADDKMVEAFTIFYRTNIAYDPEDFQLYIGTSRKDFKNAFTNYRRTVSIRGDDVKSISDSCMRHGFSSLTFHPAEVYASGDFEVIMVKDSQGKTRARCVVRVKLRDGSPCFFYNWIYASCSNSYNLLKEYIQSKGGIFVGSNENPGNSVGWRGARLLAIQALENRETRFLCPYIDTYRYVGFDPEENNMYIMDYALRNFGEYAQNSVSGVVSFYEKNPFSKLASKYQKFHREELKA